MHPIRLQHRADPCQKRARALRWGRSIVFGCLLVTGCEEPDESGESDVDGPSDTSAVANGDAATRPTAQDAAIVTDAGGGGLNLPDAALARPLDAIPWEGLELERVDGVESGSGLVVRQERYRLNAGSRFGWCKVVKLAATGGTAYSETRSVGEGTYTLRGNTIALQHTTLRLGDHEPRPQQAEYSFVYSAADPSRAVIDGASYRRIMVGGATGDLFDRLTSPSSGLCP